MPPRLQQPGAAAASSAANRKGPNRGRRPARREPKSALDSFLQSLGFRPRDAGLDPTGAPLSREQERQAIEQHWQQPD